MDWKNLERLGFTCSGGAIDYDNTYLGYMTENGPFLFPEGVDKYNALVESAAPAPAPIVGETVVEPPPTKRGPGRPRKEPQE